MTDFTPDSPTPASLDLGRAFPRRPADLHKYSAGTVAIVGGSGHFIHAPVIAGLGARAAGAGLVQLVVPDASRIAAGGLVPEATFTKLTPACVPPHADVYAIGMGLGVTTNSEMLVSRLLSGASGRFVLDADALAILSRWYAGQKSAFRPGANQTLILTPHEGEAAKLLATTTEAVHADRAATLRTIAERHSAIVVLKGARTLVGTADGDVWRCDAGNPFMAMGGMGDLLAGVIAARWARLAHTADEAAGDETARALLAARAAVWLHAAAADRLVDANPPIDPSLANLAHEIGSMRVELERRPRT